MNNFIVGQVTPTMMTNIGFGTFVFFGAFTFVGGLFVLFFVSTYASMRKTNDPHQTRVQVPETKGLTLEEMDDVFGSSGLAAADQQRQDDINKRIGLDAFDYADSNDDKRVDDEVKSKV